MGIERTVFIDDKVYNPQRGCKVAQCYITIDKHKEYIQDVKNKIGLPLLTDNNGMTHYTIYKGQRVDLKEHPYDRWDRI